MPTFSRASGSRAANCQATAAAEDTSITESRPNPISAVEARCAGGDRDDGLDHVVGDRRGHEPADPRRQHRPPTGCGRRWAARRHRRSSAATVGGAHRRRSSPGRPRGPARADRSRACRPLVGQFVPRRRPSGTATTRPQPRRQARWLDRLCRDTPSRSARSAGYAGASRSASSTRARVGSDRAWPNRASASVEDEICMQEQYSRCCIHRMLN